jgi:hypothetical protein
MTMRHDSGILTLGIMVDTKLLDVHRIINNFQLHSIHPRAEDYVNKLRSVLTHDLAKKLAQEFLDHPQAWEEKNGIIRRKICLH